MTKKRFGRDVTLRVSGPMACFTRPEYQSERVSYPIITPPATVGLLSAVFWKPQFDWRIRKLELLAEPKWASMVRNEVKEHASIGRDHIDITKTGSGNVGRAQRHSLVLVDVAYRITARVELRPHCDDDPAKFSDQFDRRVRRGAFFTPPYLGLREFPAWFETADPAEAPVDTTMPAGPMPLDLNYQADGSIQPVFFDAVIHNGVVTVPALTRKTKEA